MSETKEPRAAAAAAFETGVCPAGGTGSAWSTRLFAAVSKRVWVRIGLLFAALCLVKLAMLIGLRRYLFEVHWRVAGQEESWVSVAAFYGFALITGLNLWALGTRCMTGGARKVRACNACVLVLSAVFILLTFHEGSFNYLSPVMNGVLRWTDLGPYLAMNFLFRSPYLVIWIFLYALIYYVLTRTSKEVLVLRVTAIAAAAYIAACLKSLQAYRDALVVVDCIGIASLAASLSGRRALGWIWIGSLWSGVLFAFALFYGLDSRLTLGHATPEFAVLTGCVTVLIGGVTLIAWKREFVREWSFALPFGLAAFWLLVNVNYVPAENYNNLICAGLTWPRYFLGEAAIALGLLAAAALYSRLRPFGSLWWLDGFIFVLVAWSLADWKLTQVMGVRLDWPALSLAIGETPKMMWRMASPYLPALAGALLAAGVLYGLLSRTILQRMNARQPGGKPRWADGAGFFLLSFVLLGLTGGWLIERDKARGQSVLILARTSPLWRRFVNPPMDQKTFIETARSLGMEQLCAPEPTPQRAQRDLNVVLIFQESTYNKYLSLFSGTTDTEPLLAKYKERMEVFPNFFSSFASSIHARFATFTGLYPVIDYQKFTAQRVEAKSIFELLHDRGYVGSLFYSSFFDYTGFRDFLKARGIDELYDADTMPGVRKTNPVSWGLREEETLAAIRAQIKRYASRRQKFFLTYIPAAPHHPFDGTPPQFRKYHREKLDDYTPSYLNELLYMDWIISSIVDQLNESGLLDNTLVIITGDHGEMLGADGGPIGHGWVVQPELANVPLIVMDPGNRGYRVNYRIGSQVDLLPTTLDLLGVSPPNDQLRQGTSLYAPEPAGDRTIYLNSFREFGIIKGRFVICGDREEAARKVYAISNEDTHTRFTETNLAAIPSIPILSFDKFQENFLRDFYRYSPARQQADGR